MLLLQIPLIIIGKPTGSSFITYLIGKKTFIVSFGGVWLLVGTVLQGVTFSKQWAMASHVGGYIEGHVWFHILTILLFLKSILKVQWRDNECTNDTVTITTFMICHNIYLQYKHNYVFNILHQIWDAYIWEIILFYILLLVIVIFYWVQMIIYLAWWNLTSWPSLHTKCVLFKVEQED